MAKRVPISLKIKTQLLELQNGKCANNPNKNAVGCIRYICPMWLLYNGVFDEAGYECDHIREHSLSGSNDITNLNLLCPSCHRVKTKRASKNGFAYNSYDLDSGVAKMDVDKPPKKRQRT